MCKATIKGIALLMAIDSGLIRKTWKGYDIGPFLRFWDDFREFLEFVKEEHPDNFENLLDVIKKESDYGP